MNSIKNEVKGYGLVFKSLTCNPEIDIEAKGLYAYLSAYAGSSEIAYPSIQLICHQLNISEKRYHKYKKQLVNAGYLKIQRKKTNNIYGNNVYTLMHSGSSRTGHFGSIENGSIENGTVENDVTKNNSIKNNSIKNNNSKDSATDVASDLLEKEFEEWYEVYNKKKDKKAALTKFKAARKKHSYEQIMNGTKAYLKTVTDKQYQKYPKTFLHNESYLDDYSLDQPTNQTDVFNFKNYLGGGN